MSTADIQLMSTIADDDSAASDLGSVRRSRFASIEDVASFAMVGIAVVGFVIETLDIDSDNARGVICVGIGALAGAVASVFYRRLESNSQRLVRVRVAAWSIVRFFVAFELIRYGVAKLVNMQFYPRYYHLDTRVSELSSSALAWTFFGHSYLFQAAGGLLEVLGAVLVCFRRTTTLGALVLLPVMANIVLVDVFFEIPVRLFASVYLVMCARILWPEARRLWLTLRGDAVPVRAPLPPAALGRMATAFVIGLVIVLPSADIVHKASQRGLFRRDALEGAWNVERQLPASLAGANAPWERLYLEKGEYGFVRVGSERIGFKTAIDERARSIRLFGIGGQPLPIIEDRPAPSTELEGTYALDGKRLRIEGSQDGRPFTLDLVRVLPR